MRTVKILMLAMSLLLLAAVPVLAKEQTLFGSTSESTSVWGVELKSAPSYGSNPGLWLGGYSGKIMNEGSLYVGSAGYLLLNSPPGPSTLAAPDLVPCNVMLFYCGLTGEYTFNPGSLIHVSGSVLAGLFYSKYFSSDTGNYNFDEGIAGLSFVVEPGVNVMMNVTDSFKAGVGVSYRWVSGPDFKGMSNGDFTALSFNLILRFVEF